jgi:hypothetical protein
MVSKTKLRNYKSKKYANTLKNKKRTKMRGGSASVKNLGSVRRLGSRSRKHQPPPEEYIPHQPELLPVPPPKVKTQMDNFIDSFECPSKLQFMHVDIPYFEFKKYSCHYNKSENYEEHISYLYFKKLQIEENTYVEVYKVYAPNNQSISIEHKIINPNDQKYKEFGKLYDITPLELSVDTMQLAINTGKLEITTDKKGNSYLGFVDFPSLVITEKYAGSGFSYTSREYANWISVYEEKFDDNDKLFELIVTSDGRHIDKHTLELEIKIMQDKMQILKANKRDSDLKKIEELDVKIGELDTELIKPVIKMNNEELFIMKQNEMRTLLEGEKTLDIDETEREKQKIEEQVKYRAYVTLEDEEDNGDIGNKNVITENIGWVAQNSLWLEKYLEIKNNESHAGGFKGIKLQNNVRIQDYDKLKNSKDYKCDLSGLDEDYIIVDDKTSPGYVICGYPDKQMKEIVLNFWQNPIMKEELDKVHKEQKNNNCKWFMELFNDYNKPIKYDLKQVSEIYMNIKKTIFEYIKNRYKELYVNNQSEYKEIFEGNDKNKDSKFIENAKQYFQLIGEKYLPKPLTQIKYVFLVFKKKEKDNKISLEPFIFNIKELKKEHQPILKRIERIIKKELPTKFGILLPDENKKFPEFDDEYKLWYSRYRYGKFFHIETEYVHTMSNIADKAHNYKNTITLEELIYSCGLDYEPYNKDLSVGSIDILQQTTSIYFKKLKIQYEIRDYTLENNKSKQKEQNVNIKYNNSNKSLTLQKKCLNIPNENRSEKIFCLYENDKLEKQKLKLQQEFENYKIEKQDTNISIEIWKNNNEREKYNKHKQKINKGNTDFLNIFREHNYNKIHFILMLKTHKQEYTFIYSYDNKFYMLVIKSNISYIIDDIINELNIINNININNITFKKNIKEFILVSNNLLSYEDYHNIIFFYNPIHNNNINSNYLKTDKFCLSTYYENNMLISYKIPNFISLEVTNLYREYPLIYLNYKNSKQYTEGYKVFLLSKIQLNYVKPIYDIKLNSCAKQICSPEEAVLNYVVYNSNDCKYDILEIINNDKNKILLYVFPSIILSEEEEKIYYIRSFLDLNEKSLPMLKEIKKLYVKDNYLCFLHLSSKVMYNVLHFHLIKKNNYLLNYPEIEKGGFIIQNIHIETIINNLEINKYYYNNLEYNLIM